MKKKIFSNAELWTYADKGYFRKGDIFIDKNEIQMIWNGSNFQPYKKSKDLYKKYVGLCLSDIWLYDGRDNNDVKRRI